MLRNMSNIKNYYISSGGDPNNGKKGYWDSTTRDAAVEEARLAYEDAKTNYDAAVQLGEDLLRENEWIGERINIYDGIYYDIEYCAPSLLTSKNLEGLNVGCSCLTNYLSSIEEMQRLVKNKIIQYDIEKEIAYNKLLAAQKIPSVWIEDCSEQENEGVEKSDQ